MGIKHILARVGHPQTNGKLERVHGELQRKLYIFTDSDATKTTRSMGSGPHNRIGNPFYTAGHKDEITRFVEWYNNDRPHMSLDTDTAETPADAAIRKMPPDSSINILVEEEYNKRKEKRDT